MNRIRIFKDIESHVLESRCIESYCDHINRILFTRKSNPYKSDYRDMMNIVNSDSPKIVTTMNILSDISRLYPLDEDKEVKNSDRQRNADSNSFISLNKVFDGFTSSD